MIALQSAPALGAPAATWVLCCVVGLVLGAAGSAVVRRLSNPVGTYRLLYSGVLFPYGLVVYGLLALLDFGVAVRSVAFPSLAGLAGYVLAEFVTMLAAGIAVLVAYAPTIRGVRATRDVDLATTTALAGMARYVVGFCALLAVLFATLFRVVGGTTSTIGFAAIAVTFAVVLAVASPWIVGLLRSTRRPTAAETERLDRLRERADLQVRDVRVLADATDTASARVRGPPGYRRLFVSDTFLDAFDDGTATALLSVNGERARAHTLARRVLTVIVAGVVAVAAFGGEGVSTPLLAVAALALFAGLWFTRRGVRLADDRAGAQVGRDALADAFEEYASFHRMEPSRRRFPNPLSPNVALGDRIDRLRASGSSKSAPTD